MKSAGGQRKSQLTWNSQQHVRPSLQMGSVGRRITNRIRADKEGQGQADREDAPLHAGVGLDKGSALAPGADSPF